MTDSSHNKSPKHKTPLQLFALAFLFVVVYGLVKSQRDVPAALCGGFLDDFYFVCGKVVELVNELVDLGF
jgi:hypothetical protein